MTHIGRAQDGMKRCARCRETKATTHFNRVKRPRGDYWNAWCKPCANEYAKIRERNKRYGITSAQYDAIWAQQGGRCAICDEAEGKRQLSVDHDHETGAIRGLLCMLCNMGIGALRDDPDRLAAAMAYLIATKEHPIDLLVLPASTSQKG